jgi:hypothetical protein
MPAVAEIIHIGRSRAKMFGVFLVCIVLAAFCLWIGLFGVDDGVIAVRVGKALLFAPLFVVLALVGLFMTIFASRSVIQLTASGFRDSRGTKGEIPWRHVTAISEGEFGLMRFLVVRVDNPQDIAPQTAIHAMGREKLGLAENERSVSTSGLNVSRERLREIFLAFWEKSRQAGAPRDFGARTGGGPRAFSQFGRSGRP